MFYISRLMLNGEVKHFICRHINNTAFFLFYIMPNIYDLCETFIVK